jgi:predicted ATPase
LLLLKHPFTGVKRELQTRGACREIEVEFLSPEDVERYIALEFLGNCFPREFARLIHARTEGNPLFMVDLLRYLRDRKVIVKADRDENWCLARSLPDLSHVIPQSVGSVIERKIDQLSDRDRQVLMAAAVQGYEFDSATIARALEADSAETEEILDRLERIHAFVKRVGEDELSGGTPTVRYRFLHVLYQNALYTALTPTRRVALSADLAHALEAFYGERSSTIASQLASLYETARDPARASDYFRLAAMNAQRIFANQEAVALARRGLELLGRTPETPERTRKELDLQITLAFSLLFTRGYGAQEVRENMARARELCEGLGDTAQLFSVLCGFWLYYVTAPEIQTARRTAEQLLEIARRTEDPALLISAHVTLGVTLLHQGQIAAAQRELEEGIGYHDPTQYRLYLELYKLEPGIYGRSESVRTLWLLGYPDQARQRAEETSSLARTIPIPHSLAFSLWFAASLYQQLHETEKARQMAAECLGVCNEHGVASERAWATCLHGWAVAELGQVKEGISQIRTGLDAQLSTGIEVDRTRLLALLAEALWHVSKPEEGLKVVMDGLAISERTGNSYYDAELWRLKGELLKRQKKTAEAESCFQKAIQISRQQEAKSLELRACTSLARLWHKQGKRKEARRLLAEMYAWFTEGFDTADLKEAASLLEELS